MKPRGPDQPDGGVDLRSIWRALGVLWFRVRFDLLKRDV